MTKATNKQLLLCEAIEFSLDFLGDVINGDAYGDLDDTEDGKMAKRGGLAQVEMIRAAVKELHKILQEDADSMSGAIVFKPTKEGGAK